MDIASKLFTFYITCMPFPCLRVTYSLQRSLWRTPAAKQLSTWDHIAAVGSPSTSSDETNNGRAGDNPAQTACVTLIDYNYIV